MGSKFKIPYLLVHFCLDAKTNQKGQDLSFFLRYKTQKWLIKLNNSSCRNIKQHFENAHFFHVFSLKEEMSETIISPSLNLFFLSESLCKIFKI